MAHGDPTWRPAVAPIVRWCQELWWANFPRSKPVPALPAEFLRKAWEKAAADPAQSWNASRGALDAASLSAKRVGWRFTSYDGMITDQGINIDLACSSPKLVAKLLQEAVQRQWQRKMATTPIV